MSELREWTAWLVEGTDKNGSPRYRYADEIGMFEWTTDPLKALHFCRKEDAERFAAGDEDVWRITEHLFSSGDELVLAARKVKTSLSNYVSVCTPRPVSGDVERCIDDLIGDSKSCGGSLAVGHIDQAEYAEGHIRAGKAKLLSLLSAPSVPSNPIAVSDEVHGILDDLVNKAQHLEYVSTHDDGDAYDKAETELAESFERVLLLLNAARSKMTVTPEAGKRYMMHKIVSIESEPYPCIRLMNHGMFIQSLKECIAEGATFTPLEES